MHTYHDATQGIPASESPYAWYDDASAYTARGIAKVAERWAGWPSLFPYIELGAQWEELSHLATNPSVSAATAPPWDYLAGTVQTATLQPFICPSSQNANKSSPTTVSQSSYRFSHGDNPQHRRLSAGERDKNMRGCFGYRSWFNLSAISDGTSNTLFFSEREPGTGAVTRKIKTDTSWNIAGVFQTSTSPWYLLSRQACTNTAGAGGEYAASIANTDLRGITGKVYDGIPHEVAFHTVVPPNGPSCVWSASSYMIAATSYHTGGVNVAFADGSVHFVSDTVDVGSGDKFPFNEVASGISPFGVWGAMGSRDGGESKSL